ncbi:neuropeptide-like 1 isoform X2 [Orussus abietinus]|uniref:neuropeptide-like 1 isoform X2 n=1 Tax=Orussus abietinus TaxID=222816 RepID=UPI0006253670|nr:neuropeptide-like 1 isoform X2 [Orussus abietinus]
MGVTRSYLVSLLIYISVVNEVRLPTVTCQDEEGNQCLPRKTFFTLLRLPEISSNLAAYSRTSRIIQDVRNRHDIASLRGLNPEDADDTEICLPAGVYLELFSDPAIRGHLSAQGRAQKLMESAEASRLREDPVEETWRYRDAAEKRSIANLAKNGDLPISIQEKASGQQEEEEEEENKRSSQKFDTSPRALLEDDRHPSYFRAYSLLDSDPQLEDFPGDYLQGKRNIASLARDSMLPAGKRNVATLARDYMLPSGKRNVGALARDYMLPNGGKRNVASLARIYMLPSGGKRNIAALARDFALPQGKRYLGALVRSGALPIRGFEDEKRTLASLARNGDLAGFYSKRNVGTLARDWSLPTQNRYGRSLAEDVADERYQDGLGWSSLMGNVDNQDGGKDQPRVSDDGSKGISENRNGSSKKNLAERRSKREIDFSDEYPLPVMQNTNVLDYEEMIEALTGEYPITEKRFMGRIPQMGPRPTTPPTRRLGRR